METGANGEDLVLVTNHVVEVYKPDTDHVITHHLLMVENRVLVLTFIRKLATVKNVQVEIILIKYLSSKKLRTDILLKKFATF